MPLSAGTWKDFLVFLNIFILVLYYVYIFQGLSLAIQLKVTYNDIACKFVGTTPRNTKRPFSSTNF